MNNQRKIPVGLYILIIIALVGITNLLLLHLKSDKDMQDIKKVLEIEDTENKANSVEDIKSSNKAESIIKEPKKVYQNDIPQIFITTLDTDDNKDIDLFIDTSKSKVDAAIMVKDSDGEEIEHCDYGVVNVRGNYTSFAAKKPYNLKFDEEVSLFGMGKAKKWTLLANAYDETMLRNQIGLDFMRMLEGEQESCNQFTSKCKPADVYINKKYLGTYLLVEAVEVDDDRVDIDIEYLDKEDELSKDSKEFTINDKEYKVNDVLLEVANDCKKDPYRVDDEAYYFKTKPLGQVLAINEPEKSEDSSYAYAALGDNNPKFVEDVAKFLEDFEEIIKSEEYESDKEQYEDIKKYIDVESFIDYYITVELFKTKDINYSSTRFYIKDGKLYAGPLWDLDLSSGNICDDTDYKGFRAQKLVWFKRLMKNDKFQEKVQDRYKELRPRIKELYEEDGKIDKAYENIKKSAKHNYEDAYNKVRDKKGWGYNVVYIPHRFYVGEEAKEKDIKKYILENRETHTDYKSYIEDFKDWMKNRDEWLSKQDEWIRK